MCSSHGNRAAVGVDVDTRGSGLCEDEAHFPSCQSRMPRVCKEKNTGQLELALRRGGSIHRSPHESEEDVEVHSKGVQRCQAEHPGHKRQCAILIAVQYVIAE